MMFKKRVRTLTDKSFKKRGLNRENDKKSCERESIFNIVIFHFLKMNGR